MYRALALLSLSIPLVACDVGDADDINEFEIIEENIANGVDSTASHQSVGYVLNSRGRLHCSGTYMGSKLFLTSAHCIDDGLDATTLEVGFGQIADGNSFDVVDSWMHPDYDGGADHDIAVLEIESYPGVTVARIGRTTGGCSLHAMGYGRNEDNVAGDRQLASRCLDDIDGGRVVTTANSRRPTGLCGGDSGGGLMVAARPNVLRGVHSRSRKGCDENEPTATATNVYERDNRDWLEGFGTIRID